MRSPRILSTGYERVRRRAKFFSGRVAVRFAAASLTCAGAVFGAWLHGWAGAGIGALVGTIPPLLVERAVRSDAASKGLKDVAEVPAQTSPASLLDPRRGVVPFVGRAAELADLLAWCEGDSQGRLRLLVGPGGVGKTRLALELVEQLRIRGWSSVVVAQGKEAGAVAAARTATRKPVLLVVDYAETRAGLAALLHAVCRDERRLRVLLIARSEGEWWERLKSAEPAVRSLLATAGPVTVSPLLAGGGSQAGLIRQASMHFAQTCGIDVPTIAIDDSAPDIPVLVLHAAALVAVLDAGVKARAGRANEPVPTLVPDQDRVLADLISHEARYWHMGAS